MNGRVFLGVVFVALAAAACGGSGEVSTDSQALLDVDDVRQVLEQGDFSLSRTRQGANVDPLEHALGALFKAFTTDGVQVIVFAYLSVAARQAVSEGLMVDNKKLRLPGSEALDLPARGSALAERNLIILLVSDDDGAVARIETTLQSSGATKLVGPAA